jgi:hypothetical protein
VFSFIDPKQEYHYYLLVICIFMHNNRYYTAIIHGSMWYIDKNVDIARFIGLIILKMYKICIL